MAKLFGNFLSNFYRHRFWRTNYWATFGKNGQLFYNIWSHCSLASKQQEKAFTQKIPASKLSKCVSPFLYGETGRLNNNNHNNKNAPFPASFFVIFGALNNNHNNDNGLTPFLKKYAILGLFFLYFRLFNIEIAVYTYREHDQFIFTEGLKSADLCVFNDLYAFKQVTEKMFWNFFLSMTGFEPQTSATEPQPLPDKLTFLSYLNGPNSASFCFLVLFSHCMDKYSTNLTTNDESIVGMLGSRTRGSRMEGIDKSAELWRHPTFYLFTFLSKATNSMNRRTWKWLKLD